MEMEVDPIRVDWGLFIKEFHRRETPVVYGALADCGLVDKRSHEGLAAAFANPQKWVDAFAIPKRAILFAYGLFAWGMKEWEYSIDHLSVAKTLDGAKAALGEAKDQSENIRSSPDLPAVELIISLADSLKECMAVEDTLYISSLRQFNELTSGIVTAYEGFKETLNEKKLAGLDDSIRSVLKEIIETQLYFYTGLTYFGTVALNYRTGVASATSHEEAIRQLDNAKVELTELGPDVLASELLPYRRILVAFRDRLKLPVVQFDDVRIIYIYPFTIDHLFGADIYDKIQFKIYGKETGSDKTTGSDSKPESSAPQPCTLGGVQPRSVNEADLTDLWEWRGLRPSLQHDFDSHEYSAVDIEMPDLTIKAEDGEELSEYRVKVRITTLGNHYLRIEKDLTNPSPYEINQGLRRASSLMSEAAITCEHIGQWEPWPNLTEYAKSIVRGLSQLFDSGSFRSRKRTDYEVLSDIEAYFHVVFEVRSASVKPSDGDRRDATEEEIEQFAAPLLLQPLTRMAVAPEEWVCYSTSEWKNILTQDAFAVDFAVGTNSTTILSMPASPDWFYNSYEECIELVVSFVSLVRQWTHEVRENHEFTRARMQPREAHEDSKEFAKVRRTLHDKIVDIRKRRTFLTPSELVGSGHHRAFLENLFDIARISDMLEDLDAQLQIAELVHDRGVLHQRRLADEEQKSLEKDRDDRFRSYNDVQQLLLLFIGSFALAGVVQMFEQEVFGETESILTTPWHPVVNLLLTIVIWIVIVVLALRWLRGQRKKVDEPKKLDADNLAVAAPTPSTGKARWISAAKARGISKQAASLTPTESSPTRR